MATTVRYTGGEATVFTVGGKSHLCDVRDVTITVDWKDTNAGTLCDNWSAAYPVSYSWKMEGTAWPSSTAAASSLMADLLGQGIGSAATPLAIVLTFPAKVLGYKTGTTDAVSLTGNAFITSVDHSASRTEVQAHKFTFMGRGALALA